MATIGWKVRWLARRSTKCRSLSNLMAPSDWIVGHDRYNCSNVYKPVDSCAWRRLLVSRHMSLPGSMSCRVGFQAEPGAASGCCLCVSPTNGFVLHRGCICCDNTTTIPTTLQMSGPQTANRDRVREFGTAPAASAQCAGSRSISCAFIRAACIAEPGCNSSKRHS